MNHSASPENYSPVKTLFSSRQFSDWTTINDSIMGGSSRATCDAITSGLCLNGFLVAEKGGFISCCSPYLETPLDLSKYRGIQLQIDAEGRSLKFALSCNQKGLPFSKFFFNGLKWVVTFNTNPSGTSLIRIPFDSLQPTIRAKSVAFPVSFDASSINQLQLFYSKFGTPGELNAQFVAGSIRILIRSISAYF